MTDTFTPAPPEVCDGVVGRYRTPCGKPKGHDGRHAVFSRLLFNAAPILDIETRVERALAEAAHGYPEQVAVIRSALEESRRERDEVESDFADANLAYSILKSEHSRAMDEIESLRREVEALQENAEDFDKALILLRREVESMRPVVRAARIVETMANRYALTGDFVPEIDSLTDALKNFDARRTPEDTTNG